MSDISSAGITRGIPGCGKTCRKDVLRRVDVPVVPGAAGWARPVPGRKAQLREQVPARRAGLAGRVPAVGHDQLTAVPLALVRELAAELAPPAVRDRAGQPPVADHVLDGEVLDHDGIRRADQAGAGLVQKVLPGAAARRTPRPGTPGPGRASSGSARHRSGHGRCLCVRPASGHAGRPGSGSTPGGRSRRCAPAPAAARRRGMPGTGTPSSPAQYRTNNRKTAGGAPQISPRFCWPLRGAPDSSPA